MDLGAHLATLPSVQQATVRMLYFEGRTHCEVALAWGIDRSAVARATAAAFRGIADWVLDGGS